MNAQVLEGAFRHEAFLYGDTDEFLAETASFIRGGLKADEPTLVVLGAEKIAALRHELRAELDGDGKRVHFADMATVGGNPARIIPAWRWFVSAYSGQDRPLRGIGEPVWPARSPAELTECHRHEALLNLAFADSSGFWLLCPYDLTGLPPAVIAEARRNHTLVLHGGVHHESVEYAGLEALAEPFADPLPDPAGRPDEVTFVPGLLVAVRRLVEHHAAAAGLSMSRTHDLALAVHEVASNSVRHGGGVGTLRIWREADMLIAEVRDRGHIREPLAGRIRPTKEREDGRGLWLVHQLCDLVQIRSSVAGTAVRLHVRCPG